MATYLIMVKVIEYPVWGKSKTTTPLEIKHLNSCCSQQKFEELPVMFTVDVHLELSNIHLLEIEKSTSLQDCDISEHP